MTEARDEVAQSWYADLTTKELRRKPLIGIWRVVDFFWKQKLPVWKFYWWLAYRSADAEMMPLGNPIQSDNMPIKGFPMKYELQSGWTIPKKDLKYLSDGPLATQGLQNILVPAALGWPRVLEVVKQYAPVITLNRPGFRGGSNL
jgi:hypothetical protein